MMTPVALMTGRSDPRAPADNSPSAIRVIAVAAASAVAGPLPAVIEERTSSAPRLNASVVASAPNLLSSARTSSRCRNSSIAGMTR